MEMVFDYIENQKDPNKEWDFKQKVPRKVHVNTASREEKEKFKKDQSGYSTEQSFT